MRFHLTIEQASDGSNKVLYCGPDARKADQAFKDCAARGEARAVERFHYPTPTLVRYPVTEKMAAANREKAAKEAALAQANARALEAQKKRAQAKELSAEAKKLEAESAADNPS